MNQSRKNLAFAALLAAMSLPLGGCGTTQVSRDITAAGVAGEVIFPAIDTAVLKEGTFPNLDSLRTVSPGVSKDQLYYLLGRPHFREGYAGVREWDYLFHFRKDGKVMTCQYKAIFDREYRAQTFHWLPQSCVDVLDGDAEGSPAATERYQLSADALFEFARHGVDDILPKGREALTEIAGKLKAADMASIAVHGHTDHIGNVADNQLLSQRRALTVRQYLVDSGVLAGRITAQGWGESQPVKTCGHEQGQALIACLAPNRRVEIQASATSPR